MSDLRTRIVIEAKAADATKVVQELQKQFGQLGRAAQDADATGGQVTRTRAALQSVSSQLAQLRRAYLALQGVQAAGRALQGIFETTDAYANLAARLRLVSADQREFNATYGQLRALADRTLAPLQATAQTFTRLAPAIRNLGGGYRETLALVEAVTLSLRISGASAEEQASSLLQFAQGLQSNFQGDEFRALTENAPRLLRAVADGMGRNVTELKGLSSAGKLTADVVSNALLKSLEKLRSESANLPVTVGGSFKVLQNAMLDYAGSTDQAHGASRALADVILSVARNFKTLADTIAIVVAGFAALGIGRLVAALASVVSTGGALAGVFARLATLLGGPVGIIASITAAAAGFLAFGRSSSAVAETVESRIKALREETAKLRQENEALAKGGQEAQPAPRDRELAALEDRRAQLKARQNATAFGYTKQMFSDEIARIDREIDARSHLLDVEKQARAERDKALAQGQALRALQTPPKSIEEATKGLTTRTSIMREFEQRSKDINSAFSAAFKRALEEGNAQRAKELLQQQREAQAAAVEDRDNALAGLAPPVRVPQLRQEFDASYALLKDRLEREKDALDLSLKEQLVSVKGYFDERRRIAEDESQSELTRLRAERSTQERFLAELTARRQRAKPEQREQFDEQVFSAQQKVLELNTQIQIVQSRRIETGKRLAFEQTSAERELANALAEVRDRLAEIGGTSGEVVRDRLTRQYETLLKQLRAAGNSRGERDLLRLIDVEADQADLQKLEAEFNAALTRMRTQEQSINNQREAGLLSESAARQRILELHQETASAVDGLIPRMERLAGAIPGEEKKNAVAAMRVEFESLKNTIDDVALSVNSTVRDAFQGLFEDIARGGKSAKDIMLDLFRAIEQGISKIAAQKLADNLFGGGGAGGIGGFVSGLFGGGTPKPGSANFVGPLKPGSDGGGFWSSLSSIGSWFASIFHDGGIVGAPGARRMVDPMMFLGAPRLHTGGLALAADEIPAILQRGEEVLARDDPRHSRNAPAPVIVNITASDVGSFRRSIGQVQADITSAVARGRRAL